MCAFTLPYMLMPICLLHVYHPLCRSCDLPLSSCTSLAWKLAEAFPFPKEAIPTGPRGWLGRGFDPGDMAGNRYHYQAGTRDATLIRQAHLHARSVGPYPPLPLLTRPAPARTFFSSYLIERLYVGEGMNMRDRGNVQSTSLAHSRARWGFPSI